MALELGKKAPAFTLLDANGRKVRLGDFTGRWVVLYFYPKDETPGCTLEACEFTASLADFAKLGAVVLGVSPDSIESHRRFAERHGLEVTLLSDPKHEVMERFGAWGEKTLYGRVSEGAIRSTVLIDPTGKVAWRWKRARAAGHASAVRKRLEELSTA